MSALEAALTLAHETWHLVDHRNGKEVFREDLYDQEYSAKNIAAQIYVNVRGEQRISEYDDWIGKSPRDNWTERANTYWVADRVNSKLPSRPKANPFE